MRDSLNLYLQKLKLTRERRNRALCWLVLLSILVSGAVAWNLRIPGVSATVEAFCGYEEHVHGEDCVLESVIGCDGTEGHVHSVADCFEFQDVLSCTAEEHAHGDGCYDENGVLVCEMPVHTHSDACYTKEAVLVCEIAEGEHVHTEACYVEKWSCGLTEHTHTAECFSNTEADLETAEIWEATLPELSGYWAEDTAAIALSQLGYKESDVNFILGDNNEKKYYTRYGAWFGNEYGDWNVMFADFCLFYAGATNAYIPMSAGANSWQVKLEEQPYYFTSESKSADYVPSVGSVLFIDVNADGIADKVAVLTAISDGFYNTVEGDLDGAVGETVYATDSELVVAYLDTAYVAAAYGKGAVSDEALEDAELKTFLESTDTTSKANFKYMSYLEKYDFIADDIEGTYILSGIIDTTAKNNGGSPKLPNNADARVGTLKTLALPLRQVRTAGTFSNNDTADGSAEDFYFYELGTKTELDSLYNDSADVALWDGTSVTTNDKLGENDAYDLTAIWVQKAEQFRLDASSATTDASSKDWKDWTVYCLDDYYQETDIQISMVNVAEGKPVKIDSVALEDGTVPNFSAITYLTVKDVSAGSNSAVTSYLDSYGVLTNGFSSVDHEASGYLSDGTGSINGKFDLVMIGGNDSDYNVNTSLTGKEVYFTVDLIDSYENISYFTFDVAKGSNGEGFEFVSVEISDDDTDWKEVTCYQDNYGTEQYKVDTEYIKYRYAYVFPEAQSARYIRFKVGDGSTTSTASGTAGGLAVGEIKVYSTEIDRVNYALDTAKLAVKSSGCVVTKTDYKGEGGDASNALDYLDVKNGGDYQRAHIYDVPFMFDGYTAINLHHAYTHPILQKDRHLWVGDSSGVTLEIDLTQEAKNVSELVIYSATDLGNLAESGNLAIQSINAWDSNTNLMQAVSAARMETRSFSVSKKQLWDGLSTRFVYFIHFNETIESTAILRLSFKATDLVLSEIKVYGEASTELNYALGRYVYLYNTGAVNSTSFKGDATEPFTDYAGGKFGIKYFESASWKDRYVAAHTFHTVNYTLTNGIDVSTTANGADPNVDSNRLYTQDYMELKFKSGEGLDGGLCPTSGDGAVGYFGGAFNNNRMVFVVDLDGKKNGITEVSFLIRHDSAELSERYCEFNIRSVQMGTDSDNNFNRGWINGKESTYPTLLSAIEWTDAANGQMSMTRVFGNYCEITYTFTSTEAEYVKIEAYAPKNMRISEIEVIGSPWVNAAANKSVDISLTKAATIDARKAEGTKWLPNRTSATEYTVAGGMTTNYIAGLMPYNDPATKYGVKYDLARATDGDLANTIRPQTGETEFVYDLGRTVTDLGQVVAFVRNTEVEAGYFDTNGFKAEVSSDGTNWTEVSADLRIDPNKYSGEGGNRTKFTLLFDEFATARYLKIKINVTGIFEGEAGLALVELQAFGGSGALEAFDLGKNVLTDGKVPLFGLDDTVMITNSASGNLVTLALDLGQVRNIAQVEVYTADDDVSKWKASGDFVYKKVEVSVDGFEWKEAMILQSGAEAVGGAYTYYSTRAPMCYVARQYAVLAEDYVARYIRITGQIDDGSGNTDADHRCMLQEVKVNCLPIYETSIEGYYNGREGHVIPVDTKHDLKAIEFSSDSSLFEYEAGSTLNVAPLRDSEGNVKTVYVGDDYTVIYIYTPLEGTYVTGGDFYDYRITTYTWENAFSSSPSSETTYDLTSLGVESGDLVPMSALPALFMQTAFKTANGWRGTYGINANYNYFTYNGTNFSVADNNYYTAATLPNAAAATGSNYKARIHFGNENNSIGSNDTKEGLAWIKWNDGTRDTLPNLSSSKLMTSSTETYQHGTYGIAAKKLQYQVDGEWQIEYNSAFDNIDLFNGMYGYTPKDLAIAKSPGKVPYGRTMGKIAYDFDMEYVRKGDKLTLSRVTGADQYSNGQYKGLPGGTNGEPSESEKLQYLSYVYYVQSSDTFAAKPTNNLFPLDDVYFLDRIFERKDIGTMQDADDIYIQHTFGQSASSDSTELIATERKTGDNNLDAKSSNASKYNTYYEDSTTKTNVKYSGMTENDDFFAHNSFFGMHDELTFTIPEDYCGPLEFFFYGDDDMWVYLDGELICDIGGVHVAIAQYVDLWDYIPKDGTSLANTEGSDEHTLSLFYTERGASGSTCYVSFTLPVASTAPRAISVSKDVSDLGNTVIEDVYDDNFSFNVQFFDASGTEITSIPEGTELSYIKTLSNDERQSADVTTLPFTVSLKGGESFTMQNLPENFAFFSVQEISAVGSRVKNSNGEYAASTDNLDYYSTTVTATGGTVDNNARAASLVPIQPYNISSAEFVNYPLPSEFPETGGEGVLWFLIVGFMLTVIPMGAGIFSTVKKAKRFISK